MSLLAVPHDRQARPSPAAPPPPPWAGRSRAPQLSAAPAASRSAPDCYPGFCSRCDQPARVRLQAPIDSAEALCPVCRAAEQRDRAGGAPRPSAAADPLRPVAAR